MTRAESERLKRILLDLSVRRGTFTLTSGQTSSFYVDGRRTTTDPEGAWLVARAILDIVRERGLRAEAVGGMTLGADPIVGAIAAVSHAEGRPLPGFIVRKAAKEHGTRQRIEGTPVEGKSVIIVDDVITTAGSAIDAMTAVRAAGATVAAVVCLVDREEGGAEKLAGVPFYPIFRRSDLLEE